MSASGLAGRLRALSIETPDPKELEVLFSRENEALLPFVDWLCNVSLSSENCVTDAEAKRCVNANTCRSLTFYFFR